MTTTDSAAHYLSYFDQHSDKLLEEFFTFLRFKSVSTEVVHAGDVRRCAEWVRDFLSPLGFQVDIWETRGHPVVYASWLKAGSGKPTALFYGHYDVQPVDPIELWESAPFEPEIRDGEIYARGAQDNKGQAYYLIAALRAVLERDGRLPVNVKLVLEGEEEAGSPSLAEILPERSAELKADYLFIPDFSIHAPDQPAVTLGFRGLTCMTVEVTAAAVDLHSGGHGGVAYNANRALAELLAGLRDEKGRITVPGFYDAVVELTEEEKAKLDLRFDPAQYRALFGAEPNGGETDYSAIECGWLRPTLEINGMSGGYTGDGFKTVIPAKAQAKLSARLVPNQDPQKIASLIAEHLQNQAPAGVTITVDSYGSGSPLRVAPDTKGVRAVATAYEKVCNIPATFILTGGTIPIAAGLARVAGAETVMFGYGLPGDNIHAPNEHFGVDRLKQGLATIAILLEELQS